MESDYRESRLFKIWIVTGLVLGIVFTLMIGNAGVGLMMGLIVSFLTGIICKRTRIINA